MSKAKAKGTAAESAAVSYLQQQGWPHAERLALQGNADRGDITGTPGIVWEVKNVKSPDWPGWLREAEVERVNARADFGIVISKPTGVGLGRQTDWLAAMYSGDWIALREAAGVQPENVWLHPMAGSNLAGLGAAVRALPDLMRLSRRDFGVVEIAAKGVKDGQYWYTITALGQMVRMVRLAGYGHDPR